MFEKLVTKLLRKGTKGKKPKILFIVKNYPQLSQTYIKSEINALLDDYDIAIVASSVPNLPDTEYLPYSHIADTQEIVEFAKQFNPAVIHGHYLVQAGLLATVAEQVNKPFTIRAHSFDALGPEGKVPAHIANLGPIVNSDLCLGVLVFPFTRKFLLESGGALDSKLVDVPPVVDFHYFYNKKSNGEQVMNTGACIPKKKMEDFVLLASKVPSRIFNLYAMGHNIDKMRQFAEDEQSPVQVIEPIPFSRMPVIYKQHGWIVYTACSRLKTVGWPMAIAEAQAAGVVACMANIRPDLADYVGSSGYLFDSIDDVVSILESSPDPTKREAGFDNARQFDIHEKKHLLTDLWQPYLQF